MNLQTVQRDGKKKKFFVLIDWYNKLFYILALINVLL
jgi:hypothetical protein